MSAVAVAAVHGAMPVTIVLLLTITTLFGAFAQIVNVGVTVVRQAVTPVAFQARVSATIRLSAWGWHRWARCSAAHSAQRSVYGRR